MSHRAKLILHILCMALSAGLFQAFFILCLRYFQADWHPALYISVLVIGTVLNAAILAVDVVFYCKQKEVVYKSCITLYVLIVFFAVGFYVLLRTGFYEIIRDKDKFEEYLKKSGGFMTALFIILQFLQVVILPIPSTVTVVAGSALFGPLLGSIYSLIGIVVGSLVAFLIGRYAGYPVVAWLVGKSTLDKWLKKVKGRDKLFLSAMFLLPVFPDDVLCFVAGLSSMSLWMFLAVIIISRILAIFTTSYSITLIPLNKPWGIAVWCVLFVLVVLLFIFLYKKSDKILGWFEKKFHKETWVKNEPKKDEFVLEVVDPDGSIVSKGVKKGEETNEGKSEDSK